MMLCERADSTYKVYFREKNKKDNNSTALLLR